MQAELPAALQDDFAANRVSVGQPAQMDLNAQSQQHDQNFSNLTNLQLLTAPQCPANNLPEEIENIDSSASIIN